MTSSNSLKDTFDVFRNYGDRVLLCFLVLAGQGAMWYAAGGYSPALTLATRDVGARRGRACVLVTEDGAVTVHLQPSAH
jgi:hypothetical protein